MRLRIANGVVAGLIVLMLPVTACMYTLYAQDVKPSDPAAQTLQPPATEKQIEVLKAQIATLQKQIPAKTDAEQVKEMVTSFSSVFTTAKDSLNSKACIASGGEYWVTIQAQGVAYACMKKFSR